MGIINVLDESVANLIAAGEVVERPASAIKEMVENSLDAGATQITAEIKNGGLTFLRITDNGCGMSEEDAMMCVRPHATSKIKNARDLHAIMTLGFRGEALAAISAVTDMRIMSAKKDSPCGTLVACSYGHLTDICETGAPVGTTIICESMFAKTPARLKFMKSNATETAYVASIMERLAVSRPDVAFKFIADGTLRFSTSGDGDLKNAIYSVFGAFATKLSPVEYSHAGVRVSGFVSSPDNVRGNRAMQHFFINARAVKNKTLMASLEQAFRTYIPSDKFPSCILNIELNSSLVDVNIHPSKLEVKFSDERAVFDAVYYAVRSSLEKNLARPAIETVKNAGRLTEEKLKVVSAFVPTDKKEKIENTDIFKNYADALAKDKAPVRKVNTDISAGEPAPQKKTDEGAEYFAPKRESVLRAADFFPSEKETEKAVGVPIIKREEPKAQAEPLAVKEDAEKKAPPKEDGEPIFPNIPTRDAALPEKEAHEIPEYTIIGELYATYVLLQLSDKVILVDKHAAHERINFEIMRASLKGKTPSVQLLLEPCTLMLTPEEISAAEEFRDEITDSGFSFETDGSTVKILGIPADFSVSRAKDMFETLISAIVNNRENIEFRRNSIFESALYQTACKASIKGGIVYDEAHIKYICDNLLRYDCIKYCPHGRPVAFEISKREIERLFGRIK